MVKGSIFVAIHGIGSSHWLVQLEICDADDVVVIVIVIVVVVVAIALRWYMM